jgi:hypothetical protein
MGKSTGSTKRKSRHDIDMSRGRLYPGRLLQEINDLIERTAKSKKRKGSEISRTGEIKGLAASRVRVLYGFSIKLEKPSRK